MYINLPRRTDRRRRLLDILAVGNASLLGRLERIEAVDGRELSFSDTSALGIISPQAIERARRAQQQDAHTIVHHGGQLVHFSNHLTPGAVACALSHHAALERVAKHARADWGLILEDDVIAVVPDADLAIARLLETLPPDWDAVFLGYHDSYGKPHPEALLGREQMGARAAAGISVRAEPLSQPLFGLFAWVVRREAAQALLQFAFPIDGQVDHALSSWLVRERGRCYAVDPANMLFFSSKSEVAGDSDIQTMVTVDGMIARYGSLEGYCDHVLAATTSQGPL